MPGAFDFLEDIAPEIIEESSYRGQSAQLMIEQLNEISKLGLRSARQAFYLIIALKKLSPETKQKIIAELAEIREGERDI